MQMEVIQLGFIPLKPSAQCSICPTLLADTEAIMHNLLVAN